MNLSGKWYIAYIMTRDEDFEPVWVEKEEYVKTQSEDGEDRDPFYDSYIVFSEDGVVRNLGPIPKDVTKEEVDAAVQSGEVVLIDGEMLIDDTQHWKMDGEKLLMDLGMDENGKILWEEVPVKDGFLEIMLYRYKRAE